MAHIAKLRKVGGSVMLAIPPALLDGLSLKPDASVGVSIDDGKLIVEPRTAKRYSLDQLLREHSAAVDGDREWLDSAPSGRELI